MKEPICWRPTDAESALGALERVVDHMGREDPRAAFMDIYIIITRRVLTLLSQPGKGGFLEPQWLSHLTGRFAEEALLAAKAGLENRAQGCAAWRFANHYGEKRLGLPCKHAALGVNAHINHDLPLVVADDFLRRRASLTDGEIRRYQHDYFHVNTILDAAIPECLDTLAKRYDCPLIGRVLSRRGRTWALHRSVMKTLEIWREDSWNDAIALYRAPSLGARYAVIRHVDRKAGRIAQAFCLGGAAQGIVRDRTRQPLRLALSPEGWPNVDPGLGQISTVVDSLLARPSRASIVPDARGVKRAA